MKGVKKGIAIILMNCVLIFNTVSAADIDPTVIDENMSVENQQESSERVEGETPAEETIPVVEDQEDMQGIDVFTENNESIDESKDEEPEGELVDELVVDEETLKLLEEYEQILSGIRPMATVTTYEEELKKFPSSYQTLLKKLHAKHPKWIFVPIDTKLNWDDVVTQESVSGTSKGNNRSLLPKTSGSLLLSKASTDYNVSSASYIPKDGSTWVSASKSAVAYYADPRNFLVDQSVFMFEALDYNATYHTLEGVENILKGTDLSNKSVEYIDTSGKKNTSLQSMTYGKIILAAGIKYKINPLFLAARIRQETGGSLSNGSISGKYSYGGKSYTGYYNFFNIGATSTSTGSAVANGLTYASKAGGSYGRPWNNPLKAIEGGANFLSGSYISKGQNTIYFERFNTVVKPYYEHQYMQNLTAAASEARTTYNAYQKLGMVDNLFIFYIPVYNKMPNQTSAISIAKTQKTGKTTGVVNMRKGPSVNYATVTTIPNNTTVTLLDGTFTDNTESVSNQEKNPYWLRVSYGSKTGYISLKYLKMNADFSLKKGESRKLNTSGYGAGEKVYFETDNPAVAKVGADGTVTGVKDGTCNIYAVTSSAKRVDVVGVKVSGTKGPIQPELSSVSNGVTGVIFKWKKAANAKGYYIYRKTGNGSFKKIKTIKSASTVKYTDKTVKAGKTYTYSVKAYNGSKSSSYDKTGLKIKYLKRPKITSAKSNSSSVKIKWNKVTGAKGYIVYRKKAGESYTVIGQVMSGKTLSYTDKDVQKNVKYYYEIRAISGKYKSKKSSAKSVIKK